MDEPTTPPSHYEVEEPNPPINYDEDGMPTDIDYKDGDLTVTCKDSAPDFPVTPSHKPRHKAAEQEGRIARRRYW